MPVHHGLFSHAEPIDAVRETVDEVIYPGFVLHRDSTLRRS
ncbi:MAG: hypothetical protein ACI9KE_000370 [Polyangiales bacterium]|jgi:hypothetical protein